MDKIIQPTVVLLILSLITEKITNFYKLHFPKLYISRRSEDDEKVREKEISKVAIWVGVIVALVAKANLFNFFKEDYNLFWMSSDFAGVNLFSNIIGSICAGLFLSLGSKFFHDLLDLLLQIKNLKRKLSDQADWNFSSIQDIDNYITVNELEKINLILNPFRQKVMQIEHVESIVLDTNTKIPQVVIRVSKEFNQDNLLPTKLFYKGVNDIPKAIDIRVIKGSEHLVQAKLWPGDEIQNSTPYPGNTGSVGGKVYDIATNQDLFLTCYHVVKSPMHSWNYQPIGSEDVQAVSSNTVCGKVRDAIRDNQIDIAVVIPASDTELVAAISGIGTPILTRTLNEMDKAYGTKVRMYGMVSKLSVGRVYDLQVPAKIKYYKNHTNELESHQLDDLIFIKGITTSFSQPGDSGSFVIDEYNYLIGILVGGDTQSNLSFVIPIEKIFNHFKVKLHV